MYQINNINVMNREDVWILCEHNVINYQTRFKKC